MSTKRKFHKETFEKNFNYLKNMYLLLVDGEWHVEKDALNCNVFIEGIRTEVQLRIALGMPNTNINFTLLERTTPWVERRKGKKNLMEVRWVGPEPTEEMMHELEVILDDQKNGPRRRRIEEAKLQKQEEKETATNPIPETVAEEDNSTTVAEVILQHADKFPTTRTELKEVMTEVWKETYGEKFNKMYAIFCEIAGVKHD